MYRLPVNIKDLFIEKVERNNYPLRSNYNNELSLKQRTDFPKQSFSHRAAQRWNELADNITQNIFDFIYNVISKACNIFVYI